MGMGRQDPADNRGIGELIRDISGITFNESGTPDKQAAVVAKPRDGKGFVGRSASTTGKPGSRASKATSNDNTGISKRTFSQINRPLKSVNEIFNAQANKAKFCMPLGMNSARDLEVVLQKDHEQQQEKKKKKR